MSTIIQDYFYGKHSYKVRKAFSWLISNKRNSEMEDEMKSIWDSTSNDSFFDTARDYDKLESKIDTKTRLSKNFERYASIAAILAIFAGGMFLWSYLHFKNKYDQEAACLNLQQVTASYGKNLNTCLPDGTQVILESGSSLIYPEKFMGKNRDVILSGRALFSVAKDPEHPFIVKTKDLMITALGTEFGVDAFYDARISSTTLKYGSIKVGLIDSKISKVEYYLNPDEQLIYDNLSHDINLRQVNSSKVLSWTQGYQIFESASFDEIIKSLERHYGVRVVCENLQKIKGIYTVKFFPNEDIEDVLKILKNLTHGFTYEIDKDTVYIRII